MTDSRLGTTQNDAPPVYLCPPAPIPMLHGCWRCSEPFEAHVGATLWCPGSDEAKDEDDA